MLKSLLTVLRQPWSENKYFDVWMKSFVVLIVLNLLMTVAFFMFVVIATLVYGPLDLSFLGM